jgi:hypothetical protein
MVTVPSAALTLGQSDSISFWAWMHVCIFYACNVVASRLQGVSKNRSSTFILNRKWKEEEEEDEEKDEKDEENVRSWTGQTA